MSSILTLETVPVHFTVQSSAPVSMVAAPAYSPHVAARSVETGNSRNLTVDSLRGLAILLMFFTHAPGLLFNLNWDRIGLSGVAEVFVFLSGFTLGITSINRTLSYQFYHSTRRTGQLYLLHVATTLGFMAICTRFGDAQGAITSKAGIGMLFKSPALALQNVFTLQLQPYVCDILPLFIFLTLLSPLLLWATQYKRCLLLSSLVVYALAHLANNWLEKAGMVLFNPLSWQLCYVLGLLFSRGDWFARLAQPAKRGVLVPIAVSILLLGVFSRFAHFTPVILGYHVHIFGLANAIAFGPASSKHFLAPLRLFHFLSAAYLFALLNRQPNLANRLLPSPFAMIGRWSLQVFCFGVLLTAVLWGAVLSNTWSSGQALAAGLGGALLSWMFAWYLDLGKNIPKTLATQIGPRAALQLQSD